MATAANAVAFKFTPRPLSGLPPDQQLRCLRLNSLGSLFYFIKFCLRRRRLVERLHKPICDMLERQHIKDVLEFPRDHFKSTICTESRPMWRALPLSQQDLDDLNAWGCPDEFITWMKHAHRPERRTLLVSENITNAAKLGRRIAWHFESNAIYRGAFPETLPTTSETWSNFSLHVNLKQFGTSAAHGEGTFDFIGVGGALQSRHYDEVDEDDIVGKKAVESASVMETTIDYHRLLVGAFENEDKDHEADELVVGNRWSFHDLSSHIRENEPWFTIHTHSALGGCCAEHPADTPIFPEEFSIEKLMRWKARLGAYHFSCQFLNNPASPEDADFRPEWLGYYILYRDLDGRATIKHDVKDGVVIKDLKVGHLAIAMAVDPNHAGNAAAGRCRHAIVVVGKSTAQDKDEEYFYLLDAWAGHTSYDTFIEKAYEIARKWKLRKFGVETVAAQKYLAYHLRYRNKIESNPLTILELKGEVEAPDGTLTRKKEWRIRNVLSPIFEQGRFFVQAKFQDFIGEYNTFPKGKFCDLLDALAYTPDMLRHNMSHAESMLLLQANQERALRVNAPYCTGQRANA